MEVTDAALQKLQGLLDKLESTQAGSVRFRKFDVEILEQLETLGGIMTSALHGERASLQVVFGGDCSRIARTHRSV